MAMLEDVYDGSTIQARVIAAAQENVRRTLSSGADAGGGATGIGTAAERLSNVLLGSGEDPGLDCRAIIHIVKHCHSNIIDISFVWHCL